MRARRELWQRRESELHERRAVGRLPSAAAGQRPAPLPAGPVESYSNAAAVGALAGAAATAAVTRDARLMVAATVAATPKAARLGREGFAARLGRDLARSGVLTMDADVLRRLDRIDTVVLDAEVLSTGRTVLGTVWVSPQYQADAEQARLAAHALLSPVSQASPGPGSRTPGPGGCTPGPGGWTLGPVPARWPARPGGRLATCGDAAPCRRCDGMGA